MTTAHAEPSAGDHAHADDHAHAFDDEPIKTLPADEPRTPAWLPLLGLVLFVGVGVAFRATGNTTAPTAAPTAPTAAPATAAPINSAIKLGPEQIKQLQQAMDQQRAKLGAGSAAVPVPVAPRPPAPAAPAH
jgi:hypothetical protein